MQATYNWKIDRVLAKPVFTDKHGNVRNNVLKTVFLTYEGSIRDKSYKVNHSVHLDIIDLTNFVDHTGLTEQQVIDMALASMSDKERLAVESRVKNVIEGNNESSLVEIKF